MHIQISVIQLVLSLDSSVTAYWDIHTCYNGIDSEYLFFIDSSPSSIIKLFTCPILDAIVDPDRLANDMFVNDLISFHFKDSVVTSPHDRYQKANRLLTELYRCSKSSLVGNDVLQKFCITLKMQSNPVIDSIISEIEKAAGLRTPHVSL